MTVILFLIHHWLIVCTVVGIVAFCALEPAMALIFAKANWKTIAAVAVVGLFAMFWGWSNFKAGTHVGDKALAAMTAKRDGAVKALQADALAFRQIQATELANKAAMDAQEAAGRDALAQARSKALKDAKALQTTASRQKAAYKGDACAAMALPSGVE